MDLTLTAITAAVVTACFVTTGVKDETPVFTTEVVSEAVVSMYTIDPVEALETLLSDGYIVVAKKEESITNAVNTLTTQATVTLPTMKTLPPHTFTLQSTAVVSLFKNDVTLTEQHNDLVSVGKASIIVDKYTLQALNGYFKHASNSYPYEVIGYYNKRIVFGSVIDINVTNLSNTLESVGVADMFYIASIPARIETLTTQLPNVQTYFKYTILPNQVETLLTTLVARDPSTLSPYRTVEGLLDVLSTNAHSTIPDPTELTVQNMIEPLNTSGYLSLMPYKLTTGSNHLITEVSVTIYHKHAEPSELSNSLTSQGFTEFYTVLGIPPTVKTVTSVLGNVYPVYGEDIEAEAVLLNMDSVASTDYFQVNPYSGLNELTSFGATEIYVADIEIEGQVVSMATSGQSDVRFGDVIQISRTELLTTSLGNFKIVYNPGAEPVSNSLVTSGYAQVVKGDDKDISSLLNTMVSFGAMSLMPYKLTEPTLNTLTSANVLMPYYKYLTPTGQINLLNTSMSMQFILDRPVFATNTLITAHGFAYGVLDINLTGRSNTAVTGSNVSIAYEDPREVTSALTTLSSFADTDVFAIANYSALNTVSSSLPNVQVRVKDTTPSGLNTLVSTGVINRTVDYPLFVTHFSMVSFGTLSLAPYKLLSNQRNELITSFDMSSYVKDVVLSESTLNLRASYTESGWNNSGVRIINLNDTSIERPFTQAGINIVSGEVGTVGNQMVGLDSASVTPSTVYTASVWFRQNRAGCSAPYLRTVVNNNSLGNFTYNGNANSVNWPVNQWIRIKVTATTQANETGLYLSNYIGSIVGDKIYYYGFQLEQRGHMSDYTYENGSAIRNNVITQSFVTVSEDNVVTDVMNTLTTASTSGIVVKDTTPSALNTLTTAGQSDTRFGNTVQISRTETLITSLGAFSRVNNPGITSVMNTLTTTGTTNTYIKDLTLGSYVKTTGSISNYIGTTGVSYSYSFPAIPTVEQNDIWLRIDSTDLEQAIDIEINGTLFVNGIYGTDNVREWKEWQVGSSFLNAAQANVVRIFHDGGSADWGTIHEVQLYSKTNYVTAVSVTTSLGAIGIDVVHPITITLDKQGGTGGTDSIVTIAGFSITPSSITPPTQAHHTFNGYYTMASGGTQVINSAGTYVALEDDTYLSPVTLYAQWTDVLYTITWKSYTNVTLKTENLVYGSTSTAPTGTADTAQYDYSWPKSSTTVTGTETITETRATRSYTITWYKYGQSGETYTKRETLLYGATSTAPTGTTDTAQYDYTWPKSSTTVVGTENITETRTLLSYTITWYSYAGAVLKSETLTYGSTSTAPTGTTDTAQYQYDWPKASTTVVGTENITETRTLLSYQITWYFYSGGVAKQETLTYGSTSTAPTGTSDTAQYDYSWPKANTTVVGTESINETRVVKQYTITWKYYSGVNALVETLNYGATSTAPIGTSDTTEYDYEWPKASTTVVGAETINETRTAKSYTLTFNGNEATPSPTSKTVTFGSTYGTLAAVSKTNWEFLGWYNNFESYEQHSLVAHWPLDGNLNDISGNKLHGSLQGATANTEGKIGGSYTFANTRIHTVDFNSYLSTNAYTYTAWINRSSSQNEYNMFMGQGLPYFSFRAGGQLFWSNAVNGTQRTCATSETFNNNTWYHFTATYDGTYMKIFVNGVEKASSYQPGTMSPGWEIPFSIGDGANYTWYPFYGKVNDVRIYSEVLSVDEIKEIAQAKIMHYTFDTCGEPTTNLWQGALSVYNNLGIPATLQTTGEYFKNTPVYRLTMTPNTQAQIDSIKANLWNHGVYGSNITYTASTKYHSSIYWKAINKSDIVVNGLASNIGGWASAANYEENGWTRCISYRDGSVTENKTGHVFWSFKSPSATLGDSFIIDWCAPQIEQKDHATDYVLTTREGLLIDSSPYHRDAVLDNDYPAWVTTTNANGRGSYYIKTDVLRGIPFSLYTPEHITLNMWFKSSTTGFGDYHIPIGSSNLYLEISINTSGQIRTGFYIAGTRRVFNSGSGLLDGNWHMITSTFNGITMKAYIDGVETGSWDYTGSLTRANLSWYIGRYSTTYGCRDAYVDDVRIYATALSQDDITRLYNTQTLITSGTTVRTSKDHTTYAHWNPSILTDTPLHTMATTGASDIRFGYTLQISRTETLSTAAVVSLENQTAFNITLNANGGVNGTPTSITGLTGISITPSSITPATWTNYTLTGYWTATSGGTKYINADGTYNNLNSNTFVGAVTLYAQWTMNNVYFDYNPNPSTIGLLADISVGGVVQSNDVSDWYQTRAANSTFKVHGLTIPPGWNYSSYTTTRLVNVTVGGSGATTEVQGDGDMTQTEARAIAITVTASTYNVTVAQNGGSGSSASVSTYQPKTSSTTITMTRGTRADYRFSHWSVSGANGQATVSGDTITIPTYTTSVQPYGDLTITANWLTAIASGLNTLTSALGDMQHTVATPFTITLDQQSGSGGTTSIICVNGFYLNPTSATAPTRNGYTFGGYYTGTGGTGTQRINASGTYIALNNTTYSSDTTLYAYWTLITYTLTNDRNGGSGGNSSNTYNITTSSTLATLLGTVTKTGYTFSAWKWTSSSAGGWVNGTNYASSTNVSGKYATGTLQAQWTANSYTVTFDGNNGGTPSPTSKSVTYGSTYGTLATVTRTDYTFNGWFTSAIGGTEITSGSTVNTASNHTLYAHWIPTVASGLNTLTTALGDMQTEYEPPTYNITTSSGTGVASMSVNPTTYQESGSSQNVTITRSASTGYTLNTATITRLDSYGGSTPTVSGTTVTIPAGSWGPFRVNQTASPNSFYITLNPNTGASGPITEILVTYATSIDSFSLDMVPIKIGYTFTGFYTATSGGTQRINGTGYVSLTNTTYSSAATLYAQWTANTYTVSFNTNGGGVAPSNKTVTYGSTYGTLATITRTGYSFDGWFTQASGGTQITSTTTVTITADQILYAHWTANSFAITLNANGGTTASNSSIDVTYNTSIEAWSSTMNPTRSGYIFNGYYTATSGGTLRISSTAYVALTSTTYTSATTLYAQWTVLPSAPTVRSSTSSALAVAGLSLTITLPSGHAAGDLLIIGVSLDGSRTMSAPTGWTLLADPTNTTSNRHAVWYKTRGATESNPTITWSSTTELGTWYSIAITAGTWSGTPEVATYYASTSTPNPPSLSPSWGYNNTLWLALVGWDYNRTSSSTPANYTLLTYQAGSSTASAGHRTFYRQLGATSEDPGSITISAADTTYSHTVAVQPAVGGGTTATPTVGTPYCMDDSGFRYAYIPVTNNDTSSVTVYMNGSNRGTIGAGATSDILYDSGFSLNYNYDVDVTCQASGKSASTAVNKSGTIVLCLPV